MLWLCRVLLASYPALIVRRPHVISCLNRIQSALTSWERKKAPSPMQVLPPEPLTEPLNGGVGGPSLPSHTHSGSPEGRGTQSECYEEYDDVGCSDSAVRFVRF